MSQNAALSVPAQVEPSPVNTVSAPLCDDICRSGEPVSVSQDRHSHFPRLIDCTPAQWDAIEARAVLCMRDQLVRYHRHGGMDNAADYDRARNSWALIVMNRERITRGEA